MMDTFARDEPDGALHSILVIAVETDGDLREGCHTSGTAVRQSGAGGRPVGRPLEGAKAVPYAIVTKTCASRLAALYGSNGESSVD